MRGKRRRRVRQEEEEEWSEASAGSSDSDVSNEARSHRPRRRIHFSVQELQRFYHLPLKTAAARLGVCEAALKRICRRNNIRKWPYRKLSSVLRRISDLQEPSQPRARGETITAPIVAPFLLPHEKSAPASSEKCANLRQLESECQRIIKSAHVSKSPHPHRPSTGHPPFEPDRKASENEEVLPFSGSFTELLVDAQENSLRILADICALQELPTPLTTKSSNHAENTHGGMADADDQDQVSTASRPRLHATTT